jgi:multiple sugar transport system permease protein
MATAETQNANSGQPKKRGTLTLRAREARLAYMLVLPGLLLVLFIILFPMVWNIILSFQLIRLGDLSSLNLFDFSNLSLDNYVVGIGSRFWQGLRVTLIYTVASTTLAIIIGLWAALVAREAFRGRGLFRAFLLFPYIAPVVSVAFIWRLMLDKNFGIVNAGLGLEGADAVGWLTSRSLPVSIFGVEIGVPIALITVILFEAWRYFPFAFLFLLARIQAIPEDMYEAAQVDGATPSQRLWYVTLPQLTGVIATLFLLRFIWTFYKFEDIFLLNGGAAGTEVLTVQIFNWLFSRRNVGVAAAIGVILALALMVLVIIYNKWLSTQEE